MKTVGISDGLGGEPANDANEREWESKRFDAPFREVRRGEAQGVKASSRHVSHRRLPKPSLLEACELVHRFSHLTNHQFSLLTRHPGGRTGVTRPTRQSFCMSARARLASLARGSGRPSAKA